MKADCSYLSVLGMRVHTRYLRVKVTKDGTSHVYGVVLKSRGTRDGSLSMAKLRKMVEDGYTVSVCVASSALPDLVASAEQLGMVGRGPRRDDHLVYLTDWLPFDPSASQGRSGLFRRKDTVPAEVSSGKRATDFEIHVHRPMAKAGEDWEKGYPAVHKELANILLDGVSYGTGNGVASGNARQVRTILKLTGGADALAERLAVFTAAGGGDAEAGHAARMAFRGLLDYYESARTPRRGSTVLRAHPSVAAAVCLLPENFAALLQTEHSGVDPQLVKDLLADAVSTFVSYDEYKSDWGCDRHDRDSCSDECVGPYVYEQRETRLFETSPLSMRLFEQMARGEFTVDRLFDKSSRRMPRVEDLRKNLCIVAAAHVTDPAVLGELAQGSSMEGVRCAAAARLTDQALLGTLALKDASEYVRVSAVAALTDQKVLAEVALKDASEYVRITAIGRLTDEKVLAEVALGSVPENFRRAAAGRLTDQKVLTEIALKDASESVRVSAVAALTDQKVLAEVALKDASEDVRITAIGRLTDQKVLTEVVMKGDSSRICQTALHRVTDQKVLAEVALKGAAGLVRTTAAERLTEGSLAAITEANVLKHIRVTATERLTDQKVLAELVMKDDSEDVREAAIANLTNQTLLATVALSCESVDYRSLAIEKLTDEAVLLEVATKEPMDLLRHAAAKKITNQEKLVELAVGSDSDTVRLAAVEGLTGRQDVLMRVALTDASDGVRIAAVRRLTQDELVELVVNVAPGGIAAASESVRLAVVDKLRNETALAELALKEESASVRAAIYRRLSTDKEYAVRDMRKSLGLPA